MPQHKIIFTGPVGAGKTTALNSISDTPPLSTEARAHDNTRFIKEHTTIAMDYGVLKLSDNEKVHLYGTPGQARFDFMWEILTEGMLGFVVLIDSVRPETFREAKNILEVFRGYAETPYIVAANKQDLANAWGVDDMRIALRLDPKVKLLPCVARDKESVKSVLLELLYSILEEMEAGTF
jgi:small GTP-binding protein